MRPLRLAPLALAGGILVLAGASRAQDTAACYTRGAPEDIAKRPSPLGVATLTLGGERATLCYGRPSMRGRTIMGELVPYGTPWRMGANEATALHLPFAAEVGGVRVNPGHYSLYAVPEQGAWVIVVNRSAERWGIPISAEVQAADLGRFERPAVATAEPVEQLTITWVQRGADAGDLVVAWDDVSVSIPVRRVP